MHKEDRLLQGSVLQRSQSRGIQGIAREVGHIQADPPWQCGASDVRIWRRMEHLDIQQQVQMSWGWDRSYHAISDIRERCLCQNKVSQARKVDINEDGEVCMWQILQAMLRRVGFILCDTTECQERPELMLASHEQI